MTEQIKAPEGGTCVLCRERVRKGSWAISYGGFYRHLKCVPPAEPVSDPAPTVDTMDDMVEQSTGTAFVTSLRTAVGEVTVYDWQALASAAAQRHVDAMAEAGETVIGPVSRGVANLRNTSQYVEQYGVSADAIGPVSDVFADPTPAGPARTVAAADGFDDPTPARPPEPEFNVSGQPKARYEWRGQVNMGYTVVWPGETDLRRYASSGNPKGITRATTFNKAASDSKAINDWGKRNVVIGASLRPDVLRRAHGLTHENDRAALAGIVAELETAAGAKVSAEEGTYLHSFTEQLDAGLLTVADAPAAYRDDLQRYVDALKTAGLEPVPGLIERTTMVTEYGGVVGTFDRIFYHRASGTYVVGDLKTGKTMKYAMNETETQLWLYAHGVNQNGIYDWNTDTWRPVAHDAGVPNTMPPLIHVREDVAVIIHMPVQGEERGTVKLVHADLEAGRRHADLCHAIRSRPKSKVRAWVPPEPVHAPTSMHRVVGTAPVKARRISPEVLVRAAGLPESDRPWEGLARGVRTQQGAAALWSQAQAAGLSDAELDELADIAREAIRTHDSVSGVDTPF